MIFSEQTDKLMPAVIKAWSDIKAAVKDSVNPHLKNHYADLASVMDAVKKPLADNDLAVLQPVKDNTSSDPGATVETYIMHSSGQYMMSEFSMSAVDRKPQTIGATITYLRRYALGSMLGLVAEEDDDGNSGSGVSADRVQRNYQSRQAAAPVKQAEPAVQQAKPSNDTELARDLRNKLIELTGTDISSVKQFFSGIWPNGSPKDSSAYIKPLQDLIAYVSGGEKQKEFFKTDPASAGKRWAEANSMNSNEPVTDTATTQEMSIGELADAAAKKHNIGTGVLLLKTLDKLFKAVPDYTDEATTKAFLLAYTDNAEVFEEAKANASAGFSLKEMMESRAA